MAFFPPRRICFIVSVAHKHECRWKWRCFAADGRMDECIEEYDGFFKCVAAARALGFVPRSNWTGPLTLCFRAK